MSINTEALDFAALPALGQPLAGGAFAGITTLPDGSHVAVTLLPEQATDMDWQAAKDWAAEQEAQLPTRAMAALLFANTRCHLRGGLHWTSDAHEEDAWGAWSCGFDDGGQHDTHESFEAGAVAVRLIPLSACGAKEPRDEAQ